MNIKIELNKLFIYNMCSDITTKYDERHTIVGKSAIYTQYFLL